MTSEEIRTKFLKFFADRGHAIIPSASLVPENDPSVLFNTAGMQPLVPYLLGQTHPLGTRLADAQKCVRTGDIDDVGDNRHNTFFEMLGNWSLGDYFKKDAITWSWELLTGEFGLDPARLYVTCFEGDENAPKDEESAEVWRGLFSGKGLNPDGHIFFLPAEKNWWSPGDNGPCGPDSEMYYNVTEKDLGDLTVDGFKKFDDAGEVVEIWNDVFMEYEKKDGKVIGKLAQKNVDTGSGLERVTMLLQRKDNIFDTDLFETIISTIRSLAKKQDIRAERIVADHIRTAVFMIADGVTPSNTDRGYILRRILRRAIRYAEILEIAPDKMTSIAKEVQSKYKSVYSETANEQIVLVIDEERNKFAQALKEGLRVADKIFDTKVPIEKEKFLELMSLEDKKSILREALRARREGRPYNVPELNISETDIDKATVTGKEAFDLYQSYGFPFEMIIELVREKGLFTEGEAYREELKKHQEVSRVGSEQKFRGGLGGHSEKTIAYHTATHLLHQALHEVLGEEATQKGSNITDERLRFDFAWGEKMTDEQKKRVEDIVNEKISANLPVQQVILPKDEALATGATHLFSEKYPDQVSIYFVGNDLASAWSKEFCGGPHTASTGILGHFKIVKEEAVAAGIRRIKAVLE